MRRLLLQGIALVAFIDEITKTAVHRASVDAGLRGLRWHRLPLKKRRELVVSECKRVVRQMTDKPPWCR